MAAIIFCRIDQPNKNHSAGNEAIQNKMHCQSNIWYFLLAWRFASRLLKSAQKSNHEQNKNQNSQKSKYDIFCKMCHGKNVTKTGVKSPKIAGNLMGLSGKLATKAAIIPKQTIKNKKSIMSRFCIWTPLKKELNKKKESDQKISSVRALYRKNFFVKKKPLKWGANRFFGKNLRFLLFACLFSKFIRYESDEYSQHCENTIPEQEQLYSLESLVKTPVLIFE